MSLRDAQQAAGDVRAVDKKSTTQVVDSQCTIAATESQVDSCPIPYSHTLLIVKAALVMQFRISMDLTVEAYKKGELTFTSSRVFAGHNIIYARGRCGRRLGEVAGSGHVVNPVQEVQAGPIHHILATRLDH